MKKLIRNNWEVISQHLETRYGDEYDYDMNSWTELHIANENCYRCLQEDIVWLNIKIFPSTDEENKLRLVLNDKNNSLSLKVKTRPYRLVHKSKTYKSRVLWFRKFMHKFDALPKTWFREIQS